MKTLATAAVNYQ